MSELRVSVSVGFKGWIGGAPDSLWDLTLQLGADEAEQLYAQMEQMVAHGGEAHSIKQSKGHTSWGADSGPYLEIILYLSSAAASGVVGSAAMDLLASLVRKIKAAKQDEDLATMSESEAIERAKWIIVNRFASVAGTIEALPKTEDELTATRVEQDIDESTWTVTLTDTAETSYDVVLGFLEGVPTVRRIAAPPRQ